jgi:cell pole-organizing protein PopZ
VINNLRVASDSFAKYLRGWKMALQDQQAEPSMEEILASIRRIISEEEQTPNAAPVLDLTQTDEPAPAPAPAPAQSVAPAPADDDIVFEAVEQAVAQEVISVPEPAITAPQPRQVVTEPMADAILSNPVANQAAGSLARLAGSLRISDAPGQTVEGVVRELLKPMLKEWLDRNLAAIVEARVEAELERIARMSR